MTVQIGIPKSESVVDRQFIEIPGPDGITQSYQYDKETNTMIRKDSQIIIPSTHGATHLESDPIPESSQFLRGLMSASDKAKLDALSQTRLGVLGFQGAGFPDDGGFLQGDIILAAGSEFISLERVGNVVRFTVDTPIPLCNCEECATIYWIQDESESQSIRPPSCNGIMPSISGYGEMKVYAYPESSIFNPNKPNDFYDKKSTVPSLIFKRYENGNVTNTAEYHLTLKRREDTTTNVGWSMTPGPAMVPECTWFMGSDEEGRQIKFELMPESEPGLLGALLYNGHTITRRNAVITGYNSNVLDTNLYKVKMWSISDSKTLGDEFEAQNVWKYNNPENGDISTTLILDKTVQLLDVGEVIELYQFEISNINGKRVFKSYFNKRPQLNPQNVWSFSNGVRFGDLHEQRDTSNHQIGIVGTGTEAEAAIDDVADIRIFENDRWGITNLENNLLLSNDGYINSQDDYEPGGTLINNRLQATVDYKLPAMIVKEVTRDNRGDLNGDGVIDNDDLNIMMASMNQSEGDDCYNSDADLNNDGVVDVRDLAILATNMHIDATGTSDRPVWLWDRQNYDNFLMKTKIGLPTEEMENFPPIDIIVGGPIDNVDDKYVEVAERGIYQTGPYKNRPYISIIGTTWDMLPSSGVLRILTGVYRDITWAYQYKIWDGERVILVGNEDVFPFDEDYLISQDVTCEPTSTTDATDTTTLTSATDTTAQELPSTSVNSVVAQLLHSDYTVPALRLQFSVNRTSGQESVQLQFVAGTLSMSTPYRLDNPTFDDDYVRGFLPGEYSVSDSFIQLGFISDGIGADIKSNPSDFKVYDGGFLPAPIGSDIEKWNDLWVMKRGSQLWVWWNGLLVAPSTTASSQLPTPVAVNSPYFPIMDMKMGKVGFRLWPGSVIRDVSISSQNEGFNEYNFGQLNIDCS